MGAFTDIQRKNKNYSLRAFARSLGLNHSILSLYFRGRRTLSSDSILKINQKFKLNLKEKKKSEKDPFHQINLDQYEMISDWAHYAILGLLSLPRFKMTSHNIADHLNVEESYAKECLARLERMKLIQQSRNGRWIQTTAPLKVDNSVSTKATRAAQEKIIRRSLESLQHDPIEERDFNAVMMSFDESLIPYAKEQIKKFRRKLMLDLESRGGANRVFAFSMQLFPVSKKEDNSDD